MYATYSVNDSILVFDAANIYKVAKVCGNVLSAPYRERSINDLSIS